MTEGHSAAQHDKRGQPRGTDADDQFKQGPASQPTPQPSTTFLCVCVCVFVFFFVCVPFLCIFFCIPFFVLTSATYATYAEYLLCALCGVRCVFSVCFFDVLFRCAFFGAWVSGPVSGVRCLVSGTCGMLVGRSMDSICYLFAIRGLSFVVCRSWFVIHDSWSAVWFAGRSAICDRV